tara:strand:+ start:4504 stop:4899 length:396 start_codon:yes stop_codon:yes gene_type:complete
MSSTAKTRSNRSGLKAPTIQVSDLEGLKAHLERIETTFKALSPWPSPTAHDDAAAKIEVLNKENMELREERDALLASQLVENKLIANLNEENRLLIAQVKQLQNSQPSSVNVFVTNTLALFGAACMVLLTF